MPVKSAPPRPSPTIAVGDYRLDDGVVRQLAARARADGKVFSYARLAALAAPHDDGDRFLGRDELERAYAAIAPSRLPPQASEPHAPAVRGALQRALRTFGDVLEQHPVDAVPDGFGRVVLQSTGGVGSAAEVFVSAYVDRRGDGRGLRRLRKTNDVYFEQRAFGAAPRVFGPFAIDDVGLAKADVPPPLPDDVAATNALIASLPSQRDLRAAHARGEALRAETFRWDATGNADLQTYEELSRLQAARLTKAQREELQTLAAYRQHGPQTPAVNDWLRERPRGRHVGVALLDAACARALRLPEGTLLFRGLAADDVNGKRGDVLVDPAYLSTSLDPGTARMFADNAGARGGRRILLVIEAGPNARGLFSGNRGETEVVLPRGTKLRMIEQRREDGYTLWHMRTP